MTPSIFWNSGVLKFTKKYLRFIFVQALIFQLFSIFGYGQYPLLPVPPNFRSPSNERGQILLDGIVRKISLFHGRSDDEADWHVYIDLENHVSNSLKGYLETRGYKIRNRINQIYSELMVLDFYDNSLFDEKFFSADVTKPFLLSKEGSAHPAWDFGVYATKNQGENKNYTNHSKLNGGRAYLQGSFVNDKEHEQDNTPLLEVHPLDAIAFAMDEEGDVYSTKYGQPAWARSFVRWRVAFFSNSGFHRINGESYLEKDRTTTYYLDLPDNAYNNSPEVHVNINVQRQPQRLWDGQRKRLYDGRAWKTFPSHALEIDPRDGRKKLKVTATMKEPDNFGGIVVVDYTIRASLNQRLTR